MVSQSDFVITNSSLCMHLAGAFEVPSLTLLGDWYESTKLHHKQWGYPESIIKGKELKASINHICSVSEAYEIIQKGIQKYIQIIENLFYSRRKEFRTMRYY